MLAKYGKFYGAHLDDGLVMRIEHQIALREREGRTSVSRAELIRRAIRKTYPLPSDQEQQNLRQHA